jgi:hypothetical protein
MNLSTNHGSWISAPITGHWIERVGCHSQATLLDLNRYLRRFVTDDEDRGLQVDRDLDAVANLIDEFGPSLPVSELSSVLA